MANHVSQCLLGNPVQTDSLLAGKLGQQRAHLDIDPQIRELRDRLVRNALTALLISQGVPMLLMGDEVGRSPQGNNNAYCQDGPLNWLDWTLKSANDDLFHFCRRLIAFRKQHPVLRRHIHAGWSSGEGGTFEVSWHGTRINRPDWSEGSRVLGVTLQAVDGDEFDVVYAAFNMYWEPLDFDLPRPPAEYQWRQFVDTGANAPHDIHEPGAEPPVATPEKITLKGRSVVVLVATRETARVTA